MTSKLCYVLNNFQDDCFQKYCARPPYTFWVTLDIFFTNQTNICGNVSLVNKQVNIPPLSFRFNFNDLKKMCESNFGSFVKSAVNSRRMFGCL